jgi:nicotinate dehydrogenase subunit A
MWTDLFDWDKLFPTATHRWRAENAWPENRRWEDAMAVSKALTVNDRRVEISIDDPEMPLLYALRDNLGLRGPRFGCGLGQCGACTVHIDGKAVRSCVTPLSTLNPGNQVVTLEGLGSP